MSLRLLLNPAAGRGTGARAAARLAALAAELGAGRPHLTRDAGEVAAAAGRAAAEGVERLLVAGGDGTLHHAVQGLAGTATALGIIPLGSGNDLAATLGVPRDLAAAARRAATGPLRRIDLLRVGEAAGAGPAGDRTDATSAGGRRTAGCAGHSWTAGYAGVGFDAEVAGRVAVQAAAGRGLGARLRGPLVYPWAVVQTLARFVPPRLTVRWDGGGFDGPAMFAVFANLPRFGGGMRIAPEARVDDGLLDLVVVRAIPRRTLLRVFPRVYSGRHVGHPAVLLARAARAEVVADRPLAMFAAGEPLLELAPGRPVAVEVVPGALLVA